MTTTTTNDLFAAFAVSLQTLASSANSLDTLTDTLTTVAQRADTERSRVATLLASMPVLPAGSLDSPLGRTLGLDTALADLTAAREHLQQHSEALALLCGIATGQAEQIRQTVAVLMTCSPGTLPAVAPVATVAESTPDHAASQGTQNDAGATLPSETTPESTPEEIASQHTPQGQETTVQPATVEGPDSFVVEDITEETAVAVAALPSIEPAPEPVAVPVPDTAEPQEVKPVAKKRGGRRKQS